MGTATDGVRLGAQPKAVGTAPAINPWATLWAMMVGFFVIMVDSTIVAVANPSIMQDLRIGYDTVIWVTSAYLLAYAVPLLVAGRLGDRFGPKNLYLIGLTVFTLASLWCGLAGGIAMLITARSVQGVGAGLLTPQTLAMITRIFPAYRRGMAMSVWGATAGVATLVGPLAGGLLVDGLGWAWIFFVNVPIGAIGLVMAIRLTPDLPTHRHRFDLVGVVLSGLAVFLIVFALQEGEGSGWPVWIWVMLACGVGFMAAFFYWQEHHSDEPLVPLSILRDRDFSLSNLGVAVAGFVGTALALPIMFYAQSVCGLSPTRAAILTAPMAVSSGVLAPVVGSIIDRAHPRSVIGFGFSVLAISLTWLSIEMTDTTPIWRLVVAFTLVGVGYAFVWSPLSATATRNLTRRSAGAGSGVYNATRQLGSVLGSSAMAAFMTSRISRDMPAPPPGQRSHSPLGSGLRLPGFLREPFALAMSESTAMTAFVSLIGVASAIFLAGVVKPTAHHPRWELAGAAGDTPGPVDDVTDAGPIPIVTADDLGGFRASGAAIGSGGLEFSGDGSGGGVDDGFIEDDDFADDDFAEVDPAGLDDVNYSTGALGELSLGLDYERHRGDPNTEPIDITGVSEAIPLVHSFFHGEGQPVDRWADRTPDHGSDRRPVRRPDQWAAHPADLPDDDDPSGFDRDSRFYGRRSDSDGRHSRVDGRHSRFD